MVTLTHVTLNARALSQRSEGEKALSLWERGAECAGRGRPSQGQR